MPTALSFTTRVSLLAALALLVLAAGPAQAPAKPPKNYLDNPGLTQPRFTKDEIRKDVIRLPAFDGAELYIEVTRPKAAGRYPTILEASPYHGTLYDRTGTRILPEPRDADGNSLGLTGFFVPRGYAVVMMDLRGTGKSRGCLDHLGNRDANDLKQIVEWAAAQDWSNGRVGMTGHSYVGSTPPVAAAQRPKGLKTIVPSAGLASIYDHQFQAGVPYYLQYIGPVEAYEQLALERKLPPFVDPTGQTHTGEDFGNNMEDTGCGLPNSAAVTGEDLLSGRYTSYHAERDWTDEATKASIPVFLVHGVNDNAARVASMQWFTDRGGRKSDKLWLGQWDHGIGCCPNRRGLQWTGALHAWFDKWLAKRKVDTGPPVEVFLGDGTFAEAATGARTEILELPKWPGSPQKRTFTTSGTDALGTAPGAAASTTFTGDPTTFTATDGSGGASFVTAPLEQDAVLAGVPTLRLSASVTAPRVHLIATLYDQRPDGNRRRITQCSLNPELRNGIARRDVVVPGTRYDMAPPCYAMAQRVRKGDRLALRVSTADPDKAPTFAVDPQVTVFTGAGGTAITLPAVSKPEVYKDDLPLTDESSTPAGPAAKPVDATVTTAAPGAGARQPDLTSQFVEFTVPQDSDTAKGTVKAVPSAPADLDLYLQRKTGDGWSGDLATGGSSALDSETMAIDRPLTPGTYRIEVHNWAGPPGNAVKVTATFYDSEGVAGT
jgi:predicted acyl esterase